MNQVIVQSRDGVTLAGGGVFGKAALVRAQHYAPGLVAADGGADRLLALGARPEAVIGDLDSISAQARAQLGPDRLFRISEQLTTDFDKALRSIDAPFVLGLGFSGGLLDHGLAVLNTLIRHADRRCLILGSRDLIFAAPPELELALNPGSRLSLFPMAAVQGSSLGLRWPIDGLRFAPDALIGTSNQVTGRVRLRFAAPGMLIILPLRALPVVLHGLSLR